MKNNSRFVGKKIEAFYVPLQHKDDDDQDPRRGDPVKFDATEAVLSMSVFDIVRIVDPGDYRDYELMNGTVPFHMRNGSYDVDGLEDSIMSFFGFEDWREAEDQITEETVAQARRELKIGELKTYRVRVVQVREAWIETQACSASDATAETLEFVRDTPGLFEASEIDNAKTRYTTHEAIVQEEEVDPARQRNRP